MRCKGMILYMYISKHTVLIYCILRIFSAFGLLSLTFIIKALYSIEVLGELTFVISISVFISVIARLGSDYSSYKICTANNNYNNVCKFFTCGLLLAIISSGILGTILFFVLDNFHKTGESKIDYKLIVILSENCAILQFIATFKRANNKIVESYLLDQGTYYLILSLALVTLFFINNGDYDTALIFRTIIYESMIFIFIGLFFSMEYIKKEFINFECIIEHIRINMHYLKFTIFEYYLFWFPMVIFGFLYDHKISGIASIGGRIFQLIIFGLSLINVIYIPIIIKEINSKEILKLTKNNRLLEIIPHGKKYLLYLYLSIILSTLTVVILYVYFKDIEIALIILIFCSCGILRCYYGPIMHIYNFVKKDDDYTLLLIVLISSIATIILNNIYSSPLLTMLIYLITWAFSLSIIQKKIHLSNSEKKHLK